MPDVPANWGGMLWSSNDSTFLGMTSNTSSNQGNLTFGQSRIVQMSPLYAPTQFVIEVQAPTWLVFLQNYRSGWDAYAYFDNGTIVHLFTKKS